MQNLKLIFFKNFKANLYLMPWRKLGGKYIAYEILDQATVIYEGMIKTCARHVNDKCNYSV